MRGGRFCSARLTTLVEPGAKTMSKAFGGLPVSETVLPVGWVDEQFENYVALIEQGVFNFDITLKDLGVNRWGVLQVADFSVFRRWDRCRPTGSEFNRRIDVYHMGINELVRNGQYLAQFANGEALLDCFLVLVKHRIGVDLGPHVASWKWGDHDDPRIVPLAERLRWFVERHGVGARPRPVFPLVDVVAEGIAFDYLAARMRGGDDSAMESGGVVQPGAHRWGRFRGSGVVEPGVGSGSRCGG